MLLILFCWYYTGSNFSSHIHVMNGKSIAHSHPCASKTHSHNTQQLTAIALLTHFQSEASAAYFSSEPNPIEAPTSTTEYRSSIILNDYRCTHSLRGPPSFL